MSATEEDSGTDEKPALSNLAGELEDLIITNLHPPAAIALSQTNPYFNSCVNLHRLPHPVVIDYFQEKEHLQIHEDDHACHTCLRLKLRSKFTVKQTKGLRGKNGQGSYQRIFLDCGFRTGRHIPGHRMKIGRELKVHCGGCETLQKRFCRLCLWCGNCIEKGTAMVPRKGGWLSVRNICKHHAWEGSTPTDSGIGSILSIMEQRVPEWYDGSDGV